MNGLNQGYSYQDLLTAFLISDNLHKKDLKIGVELKENKDDFFDDIVLIVDGHKTKFQVKHSSVNALLTQAEFTKTSSNLNLTTLAKSYLGKEEATYIVATNRSIVHSPFFQNHNKQKVIFLGNKTYSIKLNSQSKPFFKKFFIESSLPKASFDLSKPGSLEKELIESLRLKVGIGYYPNHQITPRDVAGRLILLANTLRSSEVHKLIDRNEIFRYINLNVEYGHIAQEFPFISSEQRIYRDKVVKGLQELISSNKYTVLQGLPGSGKSHIFDDLFFKMKKEGMLVVKHFCYLEPTDRLAQDRIVVDAMYGNFIHQLEKLEPKIAEGIRPYFAATKVNLEKLIAKIAESGKKIVLMIDGLDHLNRVVAQNRLPPDLVDKFVEVLLELEVPVGCAVFIASQPNIELEKIIKKKVARVYQLEAWDEKLVNEFVQKHSDKLPIERKLGATPEVIKSLTEKTEGNPLYLTYALKEVSSSSEQINFREYIQNLPKLNNDLNNYYKHLIKDVTETDLSIAQTLALLDFSVTNSELAEMFPPAFKRVIDSTLKKINPLLKPGIVHSGLRIYHESFRRFIIEKSSRGHQNERELYAHIVAWLVDKGFFQSQRSYRYLIPYLIRSKENDKIYSLLGKDFLAQSLFHFHPTESIVANLNKIADSAARKQRWDIYCKAVELRRALFTYSNERKESVDEVYNEAILNVHGADMFCERLLFDGKRVFSKMYGILLCQAAEHAGGNPPWDFYDVQGESMSVQEASQVSQFQEVEAAHFLNIIRKYSLIKALKVMGEVVARNKFLGTEERQINMLLKEFDYVFGVSKNYKTLIRLKVPKNKEWILHLSVAGYLYRNNHKKVASKLCTEILKKTKDLSQILTGVMFGGKISRRVIKSDVLKLTKTVLTFTKLYDDEKPIFKEWYLALQILARIKPPEIQEARKLVTTIDGWYRAWILYIMELSLLEVSSLSVVKKAKCLEQALQNLNKYNHPFRGTPRAMDLYSIREISTDSFRRTLLFACDFPNYSEILELLSAVSKGSTAYLQGSSDGPLIGEVFNSLLKEVYPLLSEERKKEVRQLLEENTKSGTGTSIYYDSTSFEYLKLATVFSLNKRTQKSKDYLLDGCVRLVAYGHRKDVTLFEIIEPIKFFGSKKLNFAISALKKSFPLVETVRKRTDGRETKWSFTIWLNTLIDTNRKVAIQTITEVVKKDPRRDWRVERSSEHLCDELLQDGINPGLIANLYETINLSADTQMTITTGLNIANNLIKYGASARAQKLFDFICRNLYGLAITQYVSEKNNFSEILLFANKNKLKIIDRCKTYFEDERDKTLKPSLPPGASITKEKIPSFVFSELSIRELRKLVDENSPSHLLKPKNLRRLANKLLKLEGKYPSDIQDLILSLVRSGLYASEDMAGLIKMKEIFQSRRKFFLAAFTAMLCFVYARGSGGWYALADSKSNYLAKDALRLSKEIAKKTLSTELSYLFSKATYFIGPTRHFIEFLSGNGQINLAEKIWDEAYDVIKFRLPIDAELDKVLKSVTPSLNYKRDKSIEALLEILINARKAITL